MTRKLLIWGDELLSLRDRLTATRQETGTYVHVDWLRFTVFLNRVPLGEQWIPPGVEVSGNYWAHRNAQIARVVNQLKADEQRLPVEVAQRLADSAVLALNGPHGEEFTVSPAIGKGYDFYRHRLPILRYGEEVGWIGWGSSSDAPQQAKQRNTVHVNLYGTACTFAAPGWRSRMQRLIEHHEAEITRVDLALDFFDGLPGGMDGALDDYRAGACDVDGHRPKCSLCGDWANDDDTRTEGRSLYIGSREAGKQTNVYEKGHQLYGIKAGNPWVRIELRYGNKLRDIPADVLSRPADYFGGASQWHADKLTQAMPTHGGDGDRIRCRDRLQQDTARGAASRVVGWLLRTAAPAITTAFKYLPDFDFLKLCESHKLPARLNGFSPAEIRAAFGYLSASNENVSFA